MPAYTWEYEMVPMLRVMINDYDQPVMYSDSRLIQTLLLGAQFVEQELDFVQNFVVDQINQTITPDPTDRSNNFRDDSFINLTCMKAAAIIERGEARAAAGKAISAREGASSINLEGIARYKAKLIDINWNKAYDDAKYQYSLSRTHIAGAAIMSPFRVWAGDGRTVYPNAGAIDFR